MTLLSKLTCLTLVILTSCATNGRDFSFDDARRIRVGMTETEVLAIMGSPTNKSVSLDSEIWMWIYVSVGPFSPPDSKSFSVKMQDGAVVFINGAAATGDSNAQPIPGRRMLGVFFDDKLPSGDALPRVTRIVTGGLADKAGWRRGDLIVAVDSEKLRTASDVIIANQQGGKRKTFTLQRGEETVTSVIEFP